MGRQSRTNIPHAPEAGQYRNVPLHNFAVRKGLANPRAIGREMCQKTKKMAIEGDLSQFDMSFDVYDKSKSELYAVAYGLFYRIGLIDLLAIQEQEFLAFLIDIDRGYFDNPYHSFLHCIDVFYIVYFGLEHFGAARWLKKIDILGILIAALCHDIAHPGVNNLYQVNAKTKLALLYNDMSVLESYSCSQTFNLINKHALFRNLSKADYASVRGTIVKGIMATDMSVHFDLLEKLQSFCTRFDPSKEEIDLESRRLIMSSILHAADISNPCRPWDLCKKWSDLVVEEFFLQGDLEKLNSLSVSPNMDRDLCNQASISTGFIDFLVRPFFECLCNLLPKFSVYLDQLSENRKIWQDLKEEFEKQKEKEGKNADTPKDSTPRRLSVAAGTITIPGDVIERLSKQKTESRESLTKSREREPEPETPKRPLAKKDDDTSVVEMERDVMKTLLANSLQFTMDEIGSLKASDSLSVMQKKTVDKAIYLLELSSVLIEVEKDICIHPNDKTRSLLVLSTEVSNFIGKSFSCSYVRLYIVDEEQERSLFSRYVFDTLEGSKDAPLETHDESIWNIVRSNESSSSAFLDGKSQTTFVILQPISLNPQKTVGVLEVKRGTSLSSEESKLLEQMCNMVAPKVYTCYLEERQKGPDR